jgi:hypothetical protein
MNALKRWTRIKDQADGATPTTQRVSKPETATKAGAPKRFRRLKWNELVSRGDFVVDEHRRFEPWEGPSGFRADAFVKPIYRLAESRLTGTNK